MYGPNLETFFRLMPNLPNLSNLSLEDSKCEPCGVTKQSFSFLLPGLTPSPRQPEPTFDEKDYICQICSVHLNYPSEGFIPSDGEIYQLQDAFDDYRNQTQTRKEKEQFHDAACMAADKIRKTNHKRTQVELLLPGCGHQFHKMCLEKYVKSQNQFRNQCPICKTPIHPTILADLRGESASSSAAPRGLVRERSAASTIQESDSDDDGPRAQAPRVEREESRDELDMPPLQPVPVFPLPVPPPDEVAASFQEYFDQVELYIAVVQARLDLTDPEFASNPQFVFAFTAMDALREAKRIYMEYSPNVYAAYPSQIHLKWDEAIGQIVFTYILMENALDLLDAASQSGRGQGRRNYTSVLNSLFRLILKLVPSNSNDMLTYLRLGTTWEYQQDADAELLDGGARVDGVFYLSRNIGLSEGTQSDPRMQPILAFMNNLSTMFGIGENTKRTFLTLASMLKAAMRRAIVGTTAEDIQEIMIFHNNIAAHLNTIVDGYGDREVVALRETFRTTTTNAFQAIMQQ